MSLETCEIEDREVRTDVIGLLATHYENTFMSGFVSQYHETKSISNAIISHFEKRSSVDPARDDERYDRVFLECTPGDSELHLGIMGFIIIGSQVFAINRVTNFRHSWDLTIRQRVKLEKHIDAFDFLNYVKPEPAVDSISGDCGGCSITILSEALSNRVEHFYETLFKGHDKLVAFKEGIMEIIGAQKHLKGAGCTWFEG